MTDADPIKKYQDKCTNNENQETSQTNIPQLPNGYSKTCLKIVNYLMKDVGYYTIGLPKTSKVRHGINWHKVLVIPTYLLLFYYFDSWSKLLDVQNVVNVRILMLFISHSCYCYLWIFKELTFGDPSWREGATVLSNLVFVVLCEVGLFFGVVFWDMVENY